MMETEKNTEPAFRFFHVTALTDGEILLMLDKKVEGNREQRWDL